MVRRRSEIILFVFFSFFFEKRNFENSFVHFDYLISRRRQPSTYVPVISHNRTDDPKRQEKMLEDDTAVFSRENFTKNISISRKKRK